MIPLRLAGDNRMAAYKIRRKILALQKPDREVCSFIFAVHPDFVGFTFLLADLLPQIRSQVLLLEAGEVLCLILGIAGPVMAITDLVILGYYQTTAPLNTFQLVLIVLYTNLLFLGKGNFSL